MKMIKIGKFCEIFIVAQAGLLVADKIRVGATGKNQADTRFTGVISN